MNFFDCPFFAPVPFLSLLMILLLRNSVTEGADGDRDRQREEEEEEEEETNGYPSLFLYANLVDCV